MATSTIQGKIETYLGAKADSLLGFKVAEDRQGAPASSRPGLCRPHLRGDGPQPTRAHKSAAHVRTPARLSGTGYLSILPVRPRHRTLRRRKLREKSRLL